MDWFYVGFRIAYLALGVLLIAVVWQRPRPGALVAVVLAINGFAWWAYVSPLERVYALMEGGDRISNLGAAAIVAAGNSPWERVQVGEVALEPFWTVAIASLALFRPENVMTVYYYLPVLALVAVALGLYRGARLGSASDIRWELAVIVFAVLGLASIAMTSRSPIPPHWIGNFLLKPNHVSAYGLAAVVFGLRAARRPAWQLGLAMGLLAWVFLMTWAFVAAALLLAEAFTPKDERRPAALVGALAASGVIASPLLVAIAIHYSPSSAAAGATQLWRQADMGTLVGYPDMILGDLGPGLPLAIAGVWTAWSRRSALDRLLLGLIVSATAIWVAVSIGSQFGAAPEPDEVFYHVRFALAFAMGVGLARAARWIERAASWREGRGYLAVVCCCLPFTLPAYWNPPTMDRYYDHHTKPIPKKVLQYAEWIREQTPPAAIFAATPSAAYWIPALAGRRVLTSGSSRPLPDYGSRQELLQILMTARSRAEARAAAARYGVTHLAVDWSFRDETDPNYFPSRKQVLEPVFYNSRVRIFEVPASSTSARER